MNIHDTLRNLKALADNGATPGERRAAKKAYERLLAAHNIREDKFLAPPPPHRLDVPYRHAPERELLIVMGQALGLTIYNLKRKRTLKQLRFEGDPAVVVLVPELFEAHREQFMKRVNAYALGLAWAMFPHKPERKEDDDDEDTETDDKMTPEEMKAMHAGFDHGERVSLYPELQNTLEAS